jgi:hypothetical protein
MTLYPPLRVCPQPWPTYRITIHPIKQEKPAPGLGQESVWDYPRLSRVEKIDKYIRVEFRGGWIIHDIVGPFKGEPGTMGWIIVNGERLIFNE